MILESLYFFLPAYFANMAPVLLRWIPFGGKPITEKLFGSHKTWRGLVVAVLAGGLVFWLQKIAYDAGFTSLALIDYADFSVLLGFLLGAGAIIGDLVKSYFKRKQGIKPGNPWLFWDQIDFVIGGLLFSFFVYVPDVLVVLVLVTLSPVLHAAVNYIGYLLKINKKKY
ncbi:MAG: CDP-archaeol synthase [Nanoarchaeota archaeon]